MARTKRNQPQVDFFEYLEKSEFAREHIKAMLVFTRNQDEWRGLMATPPASLLERVVSIFSKETDIPLEIPFFTVLHLISGELLKREITINYRGKKINPALWTVLLASSGSGKSLTVNFLEKISGLKTFPEPASAAKFIEDLSEFNNSLWIRDEFAHLLKNIDQQAYMAELRDYLLRLYDNKPIERRTKKEHVIIEKPVLSIFGLTVWETFCKNVSAESMLDGFAQRFSYVIAKYDEKKLPRDYPWYAIDQYGEQLKARYSKLTANIKHKEYTVTQDAIIAFDDAFTLLFGIKDANKIPTSFYRRILYSSIKYAAIYHLLLGKYNNAIDGEDIAWAARACKLHLNDVYELIREYDMPDFERMVKRAEELRFECTKSGESFNARHLMRHVKSIKNARQANEIMCLMTPEQSPTAH